MLKTLFFVLTFAFSSRVHLGLGSLVLQNAYSDFTND